MNTGVDEDVGASQDAVDDGAAGDDDEDAEEVWGC